MSHLRRLFSSEPLSAPGATVELDARESHHGWNVLRFREGESVVVFDGQGRQFAATVEGLVRKRLRIVLGEPVPAAPEAAVAVALYVGLSKGPAFESVLQHAVELGATEVVPVIAERSVAVDRREGASGGKMERWRQIVLSAAKQCGRARLANVSPPVRFDAAIRRPAETAARFCLTASAMAPRLSEVLRSADLPSAGSVALLVGPEGGFTEAETAAALAAGWRPAALGSRTLRVETAALAALALTMAALGDL
jgi:16S rRNA (uracil1498-N3)-methyltransferase